MSRGEDHAVDRRAMRRAFSAASARYDAVAVLQADVRTRLLERLDYLKVQPQVVLDLGSGTGQASRALHARYPDAQIVAVDAAFGMLAQASKLQSGWLSFGRQRFAQVCGDAYRLPLAEGSVDLIVSNLMLQWCDPPDAVFAEVRRVLKPQGVLSFTSFGPDTLKELRTAWATVDRHVHVNRFVDMHDLGDALVRAGFADPVLDVERFTLTYADVMTLMRELKSVGAHNVMHGRPAGLTGRRTLAGMQKAYEQCRREGLLPASYEVVYGQAWSPLLKREARGEVVISVDQIQRRKDLRR